MAALAEVPRPPELTRPNQWLLAVAVVLIVMPAHPVYSQCPFVSSGVVSSDWERTGAFPPGFLLGVGTSSHQVEGDNTNNDWWVFETRSWGILGLGHDPSTVADSRQALRHFNLDVLRADLDRAQSLGLNCYRMSLEWSRIEPTKTGGFDPAAIDYYKAVLDEILARGMKPIVGLNHYTLPLWILNPADHGSFPGWTEDRTSDIVNRFALYAARMAQELGSRVDYWTTLNEPSGQILASYAAGVWSPGPVSLTRW